MPLPEASFLAIADDLPVGISLAKVPNGELIIGTRRTAR